MTVNFVYEEKVGRKYLWKFSCENRERVYEDLAHELVAKKINECKWIRSIRRQPMFNGFDKIYVTYDHGGRRVYTIESK